MSSLPSQDDLGILNKRVSHIKNEATVSYDLASAQSSPTPMSTASGGSSG